MERRMKKILFIFIFLGFANYVQACFCTYKIQQAFQDISKKVEDDIGAQKSSVEKLIEEINKNTDDIKAQNEVIEKIIKAETRKAVQNTQIVFLLQKIAELKTAGEM
jgi:DNA-binding transcriptional regulator GbsR (MarR family)